MPRIATIEGCGTMVCSTYDEMNAVIDRAYAVAEDQPLSIDKAFATLATQAVWEATRNPQLPSPEPD